MNGESEGHVDSPLLTSSFVVKIIVNDLLVQLITKRSRGWEFCKECSCLRKIKACNVFYSLSRRRLITQSILTKACKAFLESHFFTEFCFNFQIEAPLVANIPLYTSVKYTHLKSSCHCFLEEQDTRMDNDRKCRENRQTCRVLERRDSRHSEGKFASSAFFSSLSLSHSLTL